MQIFIPAIMFQYKMEKKEFNNLYKTLHITKDYVVFTNAKTIVKVDCNNGYLENEELNLDFIELKKLIKVGTKKKGEISFHANIKDNKLEISYKNKNEVIRGVVNRYSSYLKYSQLYNDSNFTQKITLSSDFSKLALFDKAKKIIEIKDRLITAKIGKTGIAREVEPNLKPSLRNLKIALSDNANSLITLDTDKGATWYFRDDKSPYRIKQTSIENSIDIVEMPIIL